MSARNKLVVPQAERILDEFKYEIAQEFGVKLDPNSAARANGSVGGEITKRLVRQAQQMINKE